MTDCHEIVGCLFGASSKVNGIGKIKVYIKHGLTTLLLHSHGPSSGSLR
jgi:hypothetical protein